MSFGPKQEFFFKKAFSQMFLNSWIVNGVGDLQRKTFRKSSKEAIKEPLVRTDEEKSGWLG